MKISTRTLRRHAAKVGPFKVESHADGHFRIYPDWSGYQGEPAWKRKGTAAEDDCGPGVLARMGFAEDLEEWLNG